MTCPQRLTWSYQDCIGDECGGDHKESRAPAKRKRNKMTLSRKKAKTMEGADNVEIAPHLQRGD